MAIHLTPTELAREAGLERREVIEKCMELGVPIFQGRIDKTLFLANLSEQATTAALSPGSPPPERRYVESPPDHQRRPIEMEAARSPQPRHRPVRRRSPT